MKDSRIKRFLVKWYERYYAYKKEVSIPYQAYLIKKRFPIRVMTTMETLQHIIDSGCSVSRYGDGEINLMLGNGIGFQEYDKELQRELIQNLQRDSLLICLPKHFDYHPLGRRATTQSMKFWNRYLIGHQKELYELLKENHVGDRVFGDTLVTRPYIDWKDKKIAEKIYALYRRFFSEKRLLIVEGEQTRLGVGNDLFDTAAHIRRIICPAKNAFTKIDEIIIAVRQHFDHDLILLALGPTATVLAGRLADEGYRALDVGHLDIEYEWLLNHANTKTPITGKYVNEAGESGQVFSNCLDVTYQKQIVCKIS